MNLDVKSFAVGSLIGVVVGGGIYSLYVKNMGEAGLDQAIGYNHLLECTSLLASNNAEEISSFLNTLPQKQKDLKKSDAIMTATATTLSSELKLSGMGQPLAQCSKALLERYQKIKS